MKNSWNVVHLVTEGVIEIRRDNETMYEIDVDECKTKRECLDWVRQVADKTWSDPDLIGSLCTMLIKLDKK